ncbi:hypothetical protein [Mucilaginibacter lacusdianchii]|uniref:hypothetical protein n=1 Tax=Mucilaginibacter lacusdianchii TaxID=2684211 RepID=UPI00131E6E94|nr:hypothetical protein [Mucilaginibacter sp. JXJ CY 39]
MIIYNKTWLANLRIIHKAEQAHHEGLISQVELTHITESHPVGFYLPSVFVRGGLFILTVIVAILSCGLLSLLILDAHIIDGFGWSLFLGIGCYVALEVMVKDKKYFHSGVDEALLYMAGALISGSMISVIDNLHAYAYHSGYIFCSLLIFLFCIFLTLRFADVITTIAAFASFFAILFFSWSNLGSIGEATLPFITMAAAGVLYWLSAKAQLRSDYANYHTCLDVVQILGLITLYVAGNYYVVQKVGNALHNFSYEQNTTVPFGFIFWIWTIAVPFVYIGFGIRKKNVILLRTGLLLIAAAVFTFRNYYHLLPIETMLTLAGVLVTGLAYWIHQYLKVPKHGFTQESLNKTDLMEHIKVESLIVAGTFSETPGAPADPAFKFGGGSAGGGGSSSSF